MPRTKRPLRKQEKTIESEDVVKLSKLVTDLEEKIDHQTEMECRNIEMSFKILLSSIRSEDLQKTVGQLKSELNIMETTHNRRSTRSSRAASHDDGYLTENSGQGSGELGAKKKKFVTSALSSGRGTSRRSRSADSSARRGPAAKPAPHRAVSAYRTPAAKGNFNYPVITPKVAPHTPLTLLRQPRQGEMVVSMSGSPVMVPSCFTMQQEEKANCNILLQDGTTLSLQPKQMRESQAFIPFSLMDDTVLNQLKTLKDNLTKVLKLGEKAYK